MKRQNILDRGGGQSSSHFDTQNLHELYTNGMKRNRYFVEKV